MKKTLLILILPFFLLCSCVKKYETATQAQLTAQRLISALGSPSGTPTNNITITMHNNAGHIVYTATIYTISSDGFITLSNPNQSPVIYNLGYLKSYETSRSGSNLYMSIDLMY